MKPILEVKNIWKSYKIGGQRQQYLSLRDQMKGIFTPNNKANEFWALEDINFDVERGACIGIIGKNGAGKSTLLKILSKITPPTKGEIIARGRVASLLEVGTGFHPELTGRENIYLNGSILGLRKAEIEKKFEEIVDFSGVEQFLDTPLKHFSSGMQLRLAFSVAAHLEPEILLIDEVLAVGDAAFQKKCLGKMNEVSKSGRTILFVSHNLGAVKELCTKGILLDKGKNSPLLPIDEVIEEYLQKNITINRLGEIAWQMDDAPGEELKLLNVRLKNKGGQITATFKSDEPIFLEIEYYLTKPVNNMRLNLSVMTYDDKTLFFSSTHKQEVVDKAAGHYRTVTQFPIDIFNDGTYKIVLQGGMPYVKEMLQAVPCLEFQVVYNREKSTNIEARLPGYIAPPLHWKIERL